MNLYTPISFNLSISLWTEHKFHVTVYMSLWVWVIDWQVDFYASSNGIWAHLVFSLSLTLSLSQSN